MRARDIIKEASIETKLRRAIAALKDDKTRLLRALEQAQALRKAKQPPAVRARKARDTSGTLIRVIIPDSHGAHIDIAARDAFLADLADLSPDELVWLGDHVDCGGTFSAHQRTYTNELAESYEEDIVAGSYFVGEARKRAPNSRQRYLEGNHEQHIERWAARNFHLRRDAEGFVDRNGPAALLHLKELEISYHRRSEFYDGLSIPGAIRWGKCIFVHGISHSKHATYQHLIRVGTNVVHGHTHRAQSAVERTVSSDGFGAWCPGTLAKLQPLYKHTEPSSWTHGYAVQFVSKSSGRFLHFNVAIANGSSLLNLVRERLR